MNTFVAKPAEIQRKWYIVDAAGVPLGRLASQVAAVLRGKNKPIYTPNVDTGDHVIIINADKVVLTGKKVEQKVFYKHTGYIGGIKEIPYSRIMSTKPEFAISEAVRGMMPHNSLGRKMFKKLRVYAGAEHDHAAQQPVALELHY